MRGSQWSREQVLQLLSSLQQHQQEGGRSPRKPLLVLLALGRLVGTGDSSLAWSVAESRLADLLTEFGQPSRTGRAQSAAYPFTRLRSDGVWQLDHDVPMDRVGPLREHDVIGRFEPRLEQAFVSDPFLVYDVARHVVTRQFPDTVVPDVLIAAGLDPDAVLASPSALFDRGQTRRRDPAWRVAVLQAWDRQCAFCGYDGQVGGAVVGVDAAHVRWFAFGGPDASDNGLALCVLHHKLFDLGALGLDDSRRIRVSQVYSARTDAGRLVYELHGRSLRPRPGTVVPSEDHLAWHDREVFKGSALAA